HPARVFRWPLNSVENDALGGVFDGVDNVIQPASQRMNIFAVDRSNESLIQFLDDFVSEQITVVLDLFNLVGVVGAMIEIVEEFLQQKRAFRYVRRHAIKHIEILIFFWQQAKHRFTSPLFKLLARIAEEGGKYTFSHRR